jgi:hypothetical protein
VTIVNRVSGYLKFVAQITVAAIAALVPALAGDNRVSSSEWVNVAVLTLGAVAVLGAGEFPSGAWSHMKLYVSGATAGVVALQSLVTGGVSAAEWMQIALAVVAAGGVGVVAGPTVTSATSLPRAYASGGQV